MDKKVLFSAVVLAVISIACAAVMPTLDSETSDIQNDTHPDVVIIHSPMDSKNDDLASLVAGFERLSDKVTSYKDSGKDVRIVMKDFPRDDPREDILIDHMKDMIGKDRFINPGPPSDKPDLKPMDKPDNSPERPQIEDIRMPSVSDNDLGTFDSMFVQEVIDFAFTGDMGDLASLLDSQMSANIMHMIRTTSLMMSMDTKATGLEIDDVDDSQFTVEEEESDPDTGSDGSTIVEVDDVSIQPPIQFTFNPYLQLKL